MTPQEETNAVSKALTLATHTLGQENDQLKAQLVELQASTNRIGLMLRYVCEMYTVPNLLVTEAQFATACTKDRHVAVIQKKFETGTPAEPLQLFWVDGSNAQEAINNAANLIQEVENRGPLDPLQS